MTNRLPSQGERWILGKRSLAWYNEAEEDPYLEQALKEAIRFNEPTTETIA